jgi:hypothetical protein
MYNRNLKDDYRKKIEVLLGGRKKRRVNKNNNTNTNNNTNNTNNNTSNTNDNITNSNTTDDTDADTDTDTDTNSTDTNINITNTTSDKIEGIRRYLTVNKNLLIITKIFYNLERLSNIEEKLDTLAEFIIDLRREIKELKEINERNCVDDHNFITVSIF